MSDKTKSGDRLGKRHSSYRRLMGLVWRSSPGRATAFFGFSVFRGALSLMQLYLIKLIIDAVTAALLSPEPIQSLQKILLLILVTGAVYLLAAFSDITTRYLTQAHTIALKDRLQDIIHDKSVALDLDYYENARYHDTLHRAQQEAAFRPAGILGSTAAIIQYGISLLAITGLLFSLHWSIALILLVAAIPGVVVRLKFSRKIYAWERRRTQTERMARYFSWMLTGYYYAKEVRLYNLGDHFRKRFRDLRDIIRTERLQFIRSRSFLEAASQTVGALAIFGSYAFIAYRALNGRLTIGDLVMYFQAIQRGLDYLRNLLSGLAGMYENNLFITNLFEFLDLKSTIRKKRSPVILPQKIIKGVSFENVSFGYPGSERQVLRKIDLTLRPREVIALVGPNGSGKTTIIKLLCRLYDPTEGRITLDGTDLRDFDPRDLRKEFGVIFQDYSHYHLTARENIWFGDISRPPLEQDIHEAASRVGADDFLESLPKGYNTILGNWFENSKQLSIGEWQKLSLARAFYRNAGLVILDEPMTSMDVASEAEIIERFRSLIKDRSAVLISHRFTTVRLADRIYYLENGEILEHGSHEELMKLGGRYAELFTKQASYYR